MEIIQDCKLRLNEKSLLEVFTELIIHRSLIYVFQRRAT